MATLTSADIVFYYTGAASGPSDNTLSIGGTISGDTITSALANNVYDDVSGDESATGTIEYRCIAVKDTHASADMLNAKVWITGYTRAGTSNDVMYFAMQAPTGTTVDLCADPYTGPNTTHFTVPVGNTVAWTAEGAPSSTLTYGTLAHGSWFGIWLMRSVPVTASAYSNRSVTIQVQCETTGSPLYTVTKSYVVNFDGPLSPLKLW